MNANQLITTSEVKWIISKSKPMIDGDGNDIPGSAHFIGNLPPAMARKVKRAFREAGANERDCGSEHVMSVASGETESDFSVSVSFGCFKSTQFKVSFNLCPFTW